MLANKPMALILLILLFYVNDVSPVNCYVEAISGATRSPAFRKTQPVPASYPRGLSSRFAWTSVPHMISLKQYF